jgi:hypothetical protein
VSEEYKSIDNYLNTIIFKKEQSIEGEVIESNILPQYILGAKISCFIANFGKGGEELRVNNLDGKIITAPISILLSSGHYDVYVLSKTLSPVDKTYEKLQWYSKEILVNQSSNKKMAQAEINIWNINPSKQIPTKNDDPNSIYQRINKYIDELPFSSVKKSYLKKIYLGLPQPPFWKPSNEKISSDFMALQNELSTVQDMRESEFVSKYTNNYPNINSTKMLNIKKDIIMKLINSSQLDKRYKNYFLKYYKLVKASSIASSSSSSAAGNSRRVSSSLSASGNSSKASSSSRVRNSSETNKLVSEAIKKYEEGLKTYQGTTIPITNKIKEDIIKHINGISPNIEEILLKLIKKPSPLTPLDKAIEQYKNSLKSLNNMIKKEEGQNAKASNKEKIDAVGWINATNEIKDIIKQMVINKRI